MEDCKDPKSVTLLLKGPNKHSIEQMKDAIYDGIRSVFNTLKDRKFLQKLRHYWFLFDFLEAVVPGAGAFEVAAYCKLMELMSTVSGRPKLGVQVKIV